MTWPASNQYLVDTLTKVNRSAAGTKDAVQRLRDESNVGDTYRYKYLELYHMLTGFISNANSAAAVPGISQYAKDQFGDQNLDVAAEFSAMVAAATTLRNWIGTNYPTDAGSGAVLTYTLNTETGKQEHLVFTKQQTIGFRTQADSFIATVG